MTDYVIECEKFKFRDEKFVDQLAQFLEEKISDSKIKIDGDNINVELPDTWTKKMMKLRAQKFLYQAGLDSSYRFVSLVKSKAGEGYMVVEI